MTQATTSQWRLLTGPATAAATFANPTAPATTVTFSQPGSYQLQLTAIGLYDWTAQGITALVGPAKRAVLPSSKGSY